MGQTHSTTYPPSLSSSRRPDRDDDAFSSSNYVDYDLNGRGYEGIFGRGAPLHNNRRAIRSLEAAYHRGDPLAVELVRQREASSTGQRRSSSLSGLLVGGANWREKESSTDSRGVSGRVWARVRGSIDANGGDRVSTADDDSDDDDPPLSPTE